MLLDKIEQQDGSLINLSHHQSRFFATEYQRRKSVLCAGHLTVESYNYSQVSSLSEQKIHPKQCLKQTQPNSTTQFKLPIPPHTALGIPGVVSPIIPSQSKQPTKHASRKHNTKNQRHSRSKKPLSSNIVNLIDYLGDVDFKTMSYADLEVMLQPLASPVTNSRSISISDLYKCIICGKTYGGVLAFSEHVETHVKSKLKNKCNFCGRIFTRNWLLKGHLRTHTGEKPFECEVCGKAFADKSNLRSHMLIHTSKNKSHHCIRCGKGFAQRRYLHKHQLEVCK